MVAGIAHDTPDMREMLDLRAIDYTVTPAEAPPMTGIRAPAAETGQAEPFRQWLASDVMPLLYDRYHVGEPTYVGHSFTALFGLHVLFNAPDMFARYLLASPSVWWDYEVMFRLEQEHHAAGGDPAVKVFMSMGGERDRRVFAPGQVLGPVLGPRLPQHRLDLARLPGRKPQHRGRPGRQPGPAGPLRRLSLGRCWGAGPRESSRARWHSGIRLRRSWGWGRMGASQGAMGRP